MLKVQVDPPNPAVPRRNDAEPEKANTYQHGWHLLRYGGIPFQPFRHVDSVQGGFRGRRIETPEGEFIGTLSTGQGTETATSIYVTGVDYATAQSLNILEQAFTVAPGQDTPTVMFVYDFVTEEALFIGDRLDWPSPDAFAAVLEIAVRREVLELRHVWEMELNVAQTAVEDIASTSGYPVRRTGWMPVYAVIELM